MIAVPGLPMYNVYIVSYDEKFIEEVERELSRLSRILKKSRSIVVKSLYYYRVECQGEEELGSALKRLVDMGVISWAKVERTMG